MPNYSVTPMLFYTEIQHILILYYIQGGPKVGIQ